MRCIALLAACLALTLAAPVVRGAETRVDHATTLRASPTGGETVGELAAGAAVSTFERNGAWVRVRVEGWVPVEALAGASVPVAALSAPVAAAPLAVAAVAASAGGASLEGTLEVRSAGRLMKKKIIGTGRQVWLLPAGFDLAAAGQVTAEDRALLAQLDADAERLTKEADRAMQGSSFSESTRRHDALVKKRDLVLAKRADILSLHHGRREAAARGAALFTATCGSRGLFVFPSIAPGSYRLYARLVDRDLDLEWIESVDVGSGGRRIELDESNATPTSK